MGFVSEDGVPYGSIDVNDLDSVEPKTDEAKAIVEALKAERDAGREQAEGDAKRLSEQAEAQNPNVKVGPDSRDLQGKTAGSEPEPQPQKKAEPKAQEPSKKDG